MNNGITPVYALTIELSLLEPVTLPSYHQPLARAFLYDLLSSKTPNHDGFKGMTFHANESGNTYYDKGDLYRFTVFAFASGVHLLESLVAALKVLPANKSSRHAQQRRFKKGIYGHQVALSRLVDHFEQSHFFSPNEFSINALNTYDSLNLIKECMMWRDYPNATMAIESPWRIKKTKEECEGKNLRGETRYCHELKHLSPQLFWHRLHDTFAKFAQDENHDPIEGREWLSVTSFSKESTHLQWENYTYGRQSKPSGGLTGKITLEGVNQLPEDKLKMLVLGQYTGIGQQRSSGLGRYRLTHVQR